MRALDITESTVGFIPILSKTGSDQNLREKYFYANSSQLKYNIFSNFSSLTHLLTQ